MVYENVHGKLFEISGNDTLEQDPFSPDLSLGFIINNINEGGDFSFRVRMPFELLRFWRIPIGSSNVSPKELQQYHEKVRIFSLRFGFNHIQNILDNGVYEDREVVIEQGTKLENYRKLCLYLSKGTESLICRISENFTTWAKCEECDFPDYFFKCKHIGNLRARKIKADQADGGYLLNITGECLIGKKELKNGNFKACFYQPCFEPITIRSSKLRQVTPLENDEVLKVIRGKIDTINILMKNAFRFELFKIQQQRTWDFLASPCNSEEGFSSHIQALKNIVDWMDIEKLKEKLIQEVCDISGSVNLLEIFLSEKFPDNDSKSIIKSFRNIIQLSQGFPRHKDKPKIVKSMKYFGLEYPVSDWRILWERVVSEFISSLSDLEKLISIKHDEGT